MAWPNGWSKRGRRLLAWLPYRYGASQITVMGALAPSYATNRGCDYAWLASWRIDAMRALEHTFW